MKNKVAYFVIGQVLFMVFMLGFLCGHLVWTKEVERVVFYECKPNYSIQTSAQETETTTTTTATETKTDVPLTAEMQDYIVSVAEQYDVPVALVYAVIDVESGFDENAVSATDDYGLMQINGLYHEYFCDLLGIAECKTAYNNVLVGTYLLSCYIDDYGTDLNAVLMCYNAGRGGAAQMWNNGIFATEYSAKVIDKFESYGGYDNV